MISLKQVHTYFGPNPFSSEPVIVVDVEFPHITEEKLKNSALRMTAACCDWFQYPDVPSSPEATGRFLAHWSLSVLTHVRGYLNSAGAKLEGDRLRIWLGFHDEQLSFRTLQVAADLLVKIGRDEIAAGKINEEVHLLWLHCRKIHPDYLTRILMSAARKKDIPVLPYMAQSRFWQYGWGKRSEVFVESSPRTDSFAGTMFSRDKVASKAICAALGLPVPQHVLVTSVEQIAAAIKSVGLPCVVKPLDRSKGNGVTSNIRSVSEAQKAFVEARKVSQNPIMVEAHVPGHDYRLMVIRGKFMGAFRREPPSLTGDGRRTIRELIDEVNRHRSQNLVRSNYLQPIVIDEGVRSTLAAHGLTVDSVPMRGRRFRLRTNANRSTGGTCVDESNKAHPGVRVMAEALARASGIDSLGIDYLTSDIGRPPGTQKSAIIEFNRTPGLGVMIAAGQDSDAVGAAVLGKKPGRIRTTLLISSKTLEVQSLPKGEAVGVVCQNQAWVGPLKLTSSDTQLYKLVQTVLRNPCVESLLIVAHPNSFRHEGLPIDRFDTSILIDSTLEETWYGVLSNHSRVLLEAKSMEQARELLLQTAHEVQN